MFSNQAPGLAIIFNDSNCERIDLFNGILDLMKIPSKSFTLVKSVGLNPFPSITSKPHFKSEPFLKNDPMLVKNFWTSN